MSFMITGQVTWLYAFDIAHDMRRDPIKTVLGWPVEKWVQSNDHRVPRQSFFHRPQLVRLSPQRADLPGGGNAFFERTIKLLPVGGLSIAITAPFAVERLEELVEWHAPPQAVGLEPIRNLAKALVDDLQNHLIQPVKNLEEPDPYTVFRLDPADGLDAEAWFHAHRRQVAALLTQESDPERLSDGEVAETVARHLGYYKNDFVVVDWNAALLLDHARAAAEILHVLELANLQLCELEAYDRLLDNAIERSYADIGRKRRYNRNVLRNLGELRIDLARLSDELTHAGKFLGDWHLARIYEAASARFHLADWQRVVDDKLETLDDLYQILKHDQFNRLMIILELIVILILVLEGGMALAHEFRRSAEAKPEQGAGIRELREASTRRTGPGGMPDTQTVDSQF
jgi:hypothetical protein